MKVLNCCLSLIYKNLLSRGNLCLLQLITQVPINFQMMESSEIERYIADIEKEKEEEAEKKKQKK